MPPCSLEQEYDMDTIITSPSVSYQALQHDGKLLVFDNPADFPSDPKKIKLLEPMVNGTLVFPEQYLGMYCVRV